MKKETLWQKNYNLLTLATVLGGIGGIAGYYALNFLVYDETGSTLASALLLALQVIPHFALPLIVAPWMDRFPRKPFLVWGDFIGGILYFLAGVYLRNHDFSYIMYLLFSLLLACIGAMDSLAYNSIFPSVIPKGLEEKGYTVSGILYPVMNILVMPLAAILMDTIGVANILIIQGILAVSASVVESRIDITEESHLESESISICQWWQDFCDGFRYLKGEKGLTSLFAYRAVSTGAAIGYGPILIAFFRTTPGFTAFMYSFFSVSEFIGRVIGGFFQYNVKISKKKRYIFTFLTYQTYDLMDAVLLWLPYPMMLVNRAICGFLGTNSITLRETAVQGYLPEAYRARVNAFQEAVISAAGSILALMIGLLGEVVDYRTTVTISALFVVFVCWITVWRNRNKIRMIYEQPTGN